MLVNKKIEISNLTLVEIIRPCSTIFKIGDSAWHEPSGKRGDFNLSTLDRNYTQSFGFAYKNNFKNLH